MGHRRLWTVARAAGLLGGCGVAAGTAWWLAGDLLRPVVGAPVGRGTAGPAEVSFAQALDALCAAVLLACVSWLALGAALTIASYAAAVLSPASPTTAVLDTLADRGCPPRLRRLVLACLGAAIGAGATGPALAHPSAVPDRPVTPSAAAAADGVSGLALPDRTSGSTPTPGAHRDGPGRPEPTVLVRPGDSLWTIAADLLPQGTSDRVVTTAWHRLHRANRPRIGADPDLILPGTRLGVPEQLPTEREER